MAKPRFPAGPQVPSFDAFEKLATVGTVVPVRKELLADHVTPVGALATLDDVEGSYLLESVVGGESWGRYSFVGFEPELLVQGRGDRYERRRRLREVEVLHGDPWEHLRAELRAWKPPELVGALAGLPRFWGGAVGYVPYDAVRRFEPKVGSLSEPPLEFSFAIGGTLLVFDRVRQTLSVVALARIDEETDIATAYERSLDRIERAETRLRRPAQLDSMVPPRPESDPSLPKSSFERAEFEAAVERAKEYIRAGDIFQVVLSQRFRVPLGSVDPLDIYRAMRVTNPSPYMFFLRFPERYLAGASPETLVRVEDRVAYLRPIAGTRPRGKNPAEDAALGEELLTDEKERAEHVMLVDLGRNDLGRVCQPGSVALTERMIIERYSHVMHIVSNVRGELADGIDAIDVLRASFPAGTLSGAPKVRAMQIIEELEPEPRGVYGGAVGYIGFDGNLDVAIAIRTAVVEDGELTLQAGAGIVEASDPATEYDESVNKARAALVALQAARRPDRG